MAMAITMRMAARILFFTTEVTQGPLSSVHYTHIKHTPSHVAQSGVALKIEPKCPRVVEVPAGMISRAFLRFSKRKLDTITIINNK